MTDTIDLEFTPSSYFRPQRLEQHLVSKTKGSLIKNHLQGLLGQGRYQEVNDFLGSAGISDSDAQALESLHPMFMGGNYLPDNEEGEVEIARIRLSSTTFDVTSVFASPESGKIRYRIVDEYGGDTLRAKTETLTSAPMTLGQITDFFLQGWPLLELLEIHFEDDVTAGLAFFSAESDFYPDLDRLCRQRVIAHFPSAAAEGAPEDDDGEAEAEDEEEDGDDVEAGDTCPVCDHFNSVPACDTCVHLCAWDWDDKLECLNQGAKFESAWADLTNLVESIDSAPWMAVILNGEAQRSPRRSELIDLAAQEGDFMDVLYELIRVRLGHGWSTNGMLGGSGVNVYVASPETLPEVTQEVRALLAACAVKIETADATANGLEEKPLAGSVQWQLAASGFWSDDTHLSGHSGHVTYHLAQTGPGEWRMDAVVRRAGLDGAAENDVKNGSLTDQEIQTMRGNPLETAQKLEPRHMAAGCSAASVEAGPGEIATLLYLAICAGGGQEISEFDEVEGLLDFNVLDWKKDLDAKVSEQFELDEES